MTSWVRMQSASPHTRRVGHAGTLDPMAGAGVLVLAVGSNKATRLLHHLALTDKAYAATIRLGVATHTDDAEGAPISTSSTAGVEFDDAVRAAMLPLTGAIEQVPSSVSAIRIDGQRAYCRGASGRVGRAPGAPRDGEPVRSDRVAAALR